MFCLLKAVLKDVLVIAARFTEGFGKLRHSVKGPLVAEGARQTNDGRCSTRRRDNHGPEGAGLPR
jgi:hypothetical protein